ncbi:hypothetical protein CONLIGDRAFT_719783 [Coniochaeta ligniaria NRRL 30616]|uniref:Cyanovirin-N domain-containing protein n=1 Tax=Coniochaeta ligniaria NRRL 30616 TaxID=1408157 RepID=A0A1J7I530_9PEZI|nr:hypothetical protein CONLIGDRAFT_719783 [Coniochaeta ligniaria NRRL 30616]
MRTLKLPALWLLGFIAAVSGCKCTDLMGTCATTTVFDGCCNRVQLEGPGTYHWDRRAALTAFCPTGNDEDTIAVPPYMYSRLYLDEIFWWDDNLSQVYPLNKTQIPFDQSENLTTACNSTSWSLLNATAWSLCGKDINYWQETLVGFVNSSGGVLEFLDPYHPGNAFKGGAFDQTCNNISVDGKTRWLEANCSTNPYGIPDKTEAWRPSSLYLSDCLSRDRDLGNVDLTAVREDIINRTQTCLLSNNGPDPAMLHFICPDGQWNKAIALPNFVWNQNGTLGCYDIWGRNSSAPGSQQSADGPQGTNETVPRVGHVRRPLFRI